MLELVNYSSISQLLLVYSKRDYLWIFTCSYKGQIKIFWNHIVIMKTEVAWFDEINFYLRKFVYLVVEKDALLLFLHDRRKIMGFILPTSSWVNESCSSLDIW